MKRILSLVLIFILSLSVLTACEFPFPINKSEYDVEAARDYLKTMYVEYLKEEGRVTPNDFELTTVLVSAGHKYTVSWVSDNESVVLTPNENGTSVKVDVPESKTDVEYTLTATVTAPDGKTAEHKLSLLCPASNLISIPEALAAEDGALVVVKGTVQTIDTPWDDGYKNISVTIVDDAGNKLYLYRLSTKVAVGDVIKVTGNMATYNNARQVAQGATAEIVGHVELTVTYEKVTIPQALAAADGKLVEVSGTVVEINTAWSDQYKNITVTIQDDNGNKLYVYRLSTNVTLGDVITLQGKVGSYNGDKQIAQGATATITGHVDIEGGNQGGGNENPPADKTYGVVDVPVVGTAYKFGLNHGGQKAVVFFNGKNYVNGKGQEYTWYFGFTSNAAEAPDVYLEAVEGVEGGYRLYFMNGEAKTYLRMYQDSRDGYEKNGTLEMTTTQPEEYYTYSTEYKTLIWTNAIGEQNYLGSSGTYSSISASHIEHIEKADSYLARFYAEGVSSDEEDNDDTTGDIVDDNSKLAASLDFSVGSNRTSWSADQQVWASNGITLTNTKGENERAADVADYVGPARFYQYSSLKVEYSGMKKIVFHLNADKKVDGLVNALANMDDITVSVDGHDVTVIFSAPVDSLEVSEMAAQIRVDSLDVYTAE